MEKVSIIELITSVIANGTTAFLVVLFMTIGLILPRMFIEHYFPPGGRPTTGA